MQPGRDPYELRFARQVLALLPPDSAEAVQLAAAMEQAAHPAPPPAPKAPTWPEDVPAHPAAPGRSRRIRRLTRRHRELMTYMLAHPGRTLIEIAAATGYTSRHLSCIVNAPCFRELYDRLLWEEAKRGAIRSLGRRPPAGN